MRLELHRSQGPSVQRGRVPRLSVRPMSVCPSQVHVPTLVMNGDRASYHTFFLSDTRYLILDTKACRHSRRVNIDE
jgi:hypothetical protein